MGSNWGQSESKILGFGVVQPDQIQVLLLLVVKMEPLLTISWFSAQFMVYTEKDMPIVKI